LLNNTLPGIPKTSAKEKVMADTRRENLIEVGDTSFDEEVLKSSVPVLVDYWAEWCAPCRMIGPMVDQLASEYAGQLKVAKVDTDVNTEVASRYRVRSIPTLMLFRNGEPVATKIGAVSKGELKAFVDAHVA
jgi:thioredoxin 1